MEDTSRNAIYVVVGMVLAGLLVGFWLGSCRAPEKETLLQTVEVTQTKTVRKTKTVTETVTVGATDTLGAGANCSTDYAGGCVPLDRTDATCADLGLRDLDVVGTDTYGLDADGDGTACEPGE